MLAAVGADPLVMGGGLVDLFKLLIGRASRVGSLDGRVGGDVAPKDARVLEKLYRPEVSAWYAQEGGSDALRASDEV